MSEITRHAQFCTFCALNELHVQRQKGFTLTYKCSLSFWSLKLFKSMMRDNYNVCVFFFSLVNVVWRSRSICFFFVFCINGRYVFFRLIVLSSKPIQLTIVEAQFWYANRRVNGAKPLCDCSVKICEKLPFKMEHEHEGRFPAWNSTVEKVV